MLHVNLKFTSLQRELQWSQHFGHGNFLLEKLKFKTQFFQVHLIVIV